MKPKTLIDLTEPEHIVEYIFEKNVMSNSNVVNKYILKGICASNERCSICFDDLNSVKETAFIKHCTHAYHLKCLGNIQKCPLCRVPFNRKDIYKYIEN